MAYVYKQSMWKTVYRPFGSIDFHAATGILFRVQRINVSQYTGIK